MAQAIIDGKAHPVRVEQLIENNYAVSVLTTEPVVKATVTLASRPAALLRSKVNAKSPEGALRSALASFKEAGSIQDYRLEPHEEAPVEAPEAPAADAAKPAKAPLSPEEKEALKKAAEEKRAAKAAAAADPKPPADA